MMLQEECNRASSGGSHLLAATLSIFPLVDMVEVFRPPEIARAILLRLVWEHTCGPWS